MKEECVTYEQAIALKQLGFNLEVNHYYDDEKDLVESLADYNNEDSFNSQETAYDDFNHGYCDEISCSAPTLSQAQKWLRDCKDVIVIAEPDWDEEIQCLSDYLTGKWYFTVWKDSNRVRCNFNPNKECEEIWLFDTYELALSAGIDAALELLTDKNNDK